MIAADTGKKRDMGEEEEKRLSDIDSSSSIGNASTLVLGSSSFKWYLINSTIACSIQVAPRMESQIEFSGPDDSC